MSSYVTKELLTKIRKIRMKTGQVGIRIGRNINTDKIVDFNLFYSRDSLDSYIRNLEGKE